MAPPEGQPLAVGLMAACVISSPSHQGSAVRWAVTTQNLMQSPMLPAAAPQ